MINFQRWIRRAFTVPTMIVVPSKKENNNCKKHNKHAQLGHPNASLATHRVCGTSSQSSSNSLQEYVVKQFLLINPGRNTHTHIHADLEFFPSGFITSKKKCWSWNCPKFGDTKGVESSIRSVYSQPFRSNHLPPSTRSNTPASSGSSRTHRRPSTPQFCNRSSWGSEIFFQLFLIIKVILDFHVKDLSSLSAPNTLVSVSPPFQSQYKYIYTNRKSWNTGPPNDWMSSPMTLSSIPHLDSLELMWIDHLPVVPVSGNPRACFFHQAHNLEKWGKVSKTKPHNNHDNTVITTIMMMIMIIMIKKKRKGHYWGWIESK